MKTFFSILLCLSILFAFVACSSETVVPEEVDYSQFAGEYYDEYSGRATARVTESEDGKGALVEVHWSTGANGMNYWKMTVSLQDDKLVYFDGSLQTITFNDSGDEESSIMEYENESGYFVWESGRMSWSGAKDEYCKNCVFIVFKMDSMR